MPGYTLERASELIRYEGLENYLAAKATRPGRAGAGRTPGRWRCRVYHSLAGYPMGMVIGKLDNPWVNRLVNDIRTRHGNRVLPK